MQGEGEKQPSIVVIVLPPAIQTYTHAEGEKCAMELSPYKHCKLRHIFILIQKQDATQTHGKAEGLSLRLFLYQTSSMKHTAQLT